MGIWGLSVAALEGEDILLTKEDASGGSVCRVKSGSQKRLSMLKAQLNDIFGSPQPRALFGGGELLTRNR